VGARAPSSYTLIKVIYSPAAFRNLSAAGPRFATYRVGSHARLDSRRAETETINLSRVLFRA